MSALVRSTAGTANLNLPVFRLNGVASGGDHIAANGAGLGVDIGGTGVWATQHRTSDPTLYGADRLLRHIRDVLAPTEASNNIGLTQANVEQYDIVYAAFGTTDAAKTVTLADAATVWNGRVVQLLVSKAATSGSRAVTLVSAASETTLVKPTGDAAGAATVTLIAGGTAAALAGFTLVGAGGLIYVFKN